MASRAACGSPRTSQFEFMASTGSLEDDFECDPNMNECEVLAGHSIFRTGTGDVGGR